MRLRVFVFTVGEKVTFETLESIKQFTNHPYELTVWYDACGRGVDAYFLGRLGEHTNDIVVVRQNKGVSAALGFATLSLDFDYLIIAAADMIMLPGYVDRLLAPFNELENVAVTGEGWRYLNGGMSVSDFDIGIDGVVMVSKKAINAIGSVSPSFNGRGPMHTEWFRRFASNGFKYVTLDGLCLHGGSQHEGRDMIPDWRKELHQDNLVYLHADKLGYRGYPWWSNDIRKEGPCLEPKQLQQTA